MNEVMRVLLVDDEELGRDVLRLRLESAPDLEIIGEAADGDEAVSEILRLRPDLVFLDVQMPGRDGLEVLEAVAGEYLPAVVFVTAHDEHAVRAFELHALDYLLKPVTPSRLLEALDRARAQRARDQFAEAHRRVASFLDRRDGLAAAEGTGPAPAPPPRSHTESDPPLRRIVVREDDDYLLVKVDEVQAFEAAGNYVRIVVSDGAWLVRGTLKEYERTLDPDAFARIHRSTIVNLDRLERVTPELHGDFTVTLAGGRQYRMSRTYRDRVLP